MTLHDTQEAAAEFAKTIDGVWGLIQIREKSTSPQQWIVVKQHPANIEMAVKQGRLKIYHVGQSVCLRTPVAEPAPTKCDDCRRETGDLKPVGGKTRFNGRSVDTVYHLCRGCRNMRSVMAQD